MYHTTGLTKQQMTELCALITATYPAFSKKRGRKRALGLFKSVQIALTYLRRNRVQHDLAETFGVSQSTVSRIITTLVPRIVAVLGDLVPTADDLDPHAQLLVDGTLLPCWSWSEHPELWSGKHRATGVNVQVACTLSGELAWVSDPSPGRTHDARAIGESGLLEGRVDDLADKGYVGTGMITPIRKPPGGELHESQKQFNKQVNSIRSVVERVIANLKTWRTFDTDYRRPLHTFAETITAVLSLEFYRMAF